MKYQLLRKKSTNARFVRIVKTGEEIFESEQPERYAKLRKQILKNESKRMFEQAMKDIGLTKVRGAVSGKVYWE